MRRLSTGEPECGPRRSDFLAFNEVKRQACLSTLDIETVQFSFVAYTHGIALVESGKARDNIKPNDSIVFSKAI